MTTRRTSRLAAPLVLAGLLIGGCSDDSTPAASAAPTTTLAGTAATGAPMAGAGIVVRCSGGVVRTTTSAASGDFSVSVPTSSLPCALRAAPAGGGTPLHAVTSGSGSALTVNITPLTDLIAALAVNSAAGQALATWFADPTSLDSVSGGLAAAQTTLENALTSAGYSLPAPFAPLDTPFTADFSVDAYDRLLEAIATGMAGAAIDYDTLLADLLDGSPGLPAAPGAVDITALSAASGDVGDEITITGTGFGTDPFHLEVRFSTNVAAEIVSVSDTSLVVKVPDGATNGPVSVYNIITDSADDSASFTVTGGGGGTPATWTARASPSAFLLNGVAYGSSTFVTVGYSRTLLTSSDGVSWTSRTAADSNFYAGNAITWDGSQFVMVGDSSNLSSYAPLIATSPDGITWTRRSWTHGSETQLVDVAGTASRLTAVGLNGVLISSTDGGATWSAESLPVVASIGSLSGVADNGSTRVAVGRDSAYYGVILVNTGSGWAQAGSAMATFAPRDVIWNGSLWLAVGATSYNFGADPVVMYSSDGSNWTRVDLPAEAVPADFTLRDVAWTGSQFVVVGDNNGTTRVVATSPDGATWTQAHTSTHAGNSVLEGVAAGGGKVVAVGGTRTVTSP